MKNRAGPNLKKKYQSRIEQVIDYLYSHSHEKISLDDISRIANFSACHFHRQFRAATGFPVYRFLQLLRLKHASRSLGFEPEKSITDVAFDAGFENPESFSRAFKNTFNMTPSSFRKNPDWQRWQTLFDIPLLNRSETMDVKIINFPETLIAALEHHGPEPQVYRTTQKFVQWRQANGIRPDTGATYGLHYSDPVSTLPEKYRFDIAVSVDGPVQDNPQGVITKIIPAGRCAVIRHHGSREHIPAADYLYREWLPQSGEELRDYPFFFHYLNIGPDIRDRDMITDLYLPLQ